MGARLAVSALSIIFAPIYLKLYGVEAYGLVAIYGLFQSVFVMADLGLTTALLQKVAQLKIEPKSKPEILRVYLTLEYIFALIGGVFFLFLYFGAEYVARNWIELETTSVEVAVASIKLMALAICLQAPFMLAQAGLTGLEKFMALNIVNIVVAIMRTVGVVGVYQINQSLETFFFWHVLVTVFQAILGFILIRKAFEIKLNAVQFDLLSIIPLWKFASGGAVITITGFILTQADKFLLTKLVTVKEFGLYSLATVVAAIPSLVAFPIKASVQPRLVQLVRNGNMQEIWSFYETACAFLACAIIPMSLMLILFPSEIVYVWTGDESVAESVSLLVPVLSLGTLFMCLMLIPFTLQLAYEWTSLTIYSNIISIVLFIPLTVYLVNDYGVIGAGFLMLFVYLFQFFIVTGFIHFRVFNKICIRWYFKIFIMPTFLLLSISFPFWYLSGPFESRWSGVPLLLFLSVLLLLASVFCFGELRSRLFERFRKKVSD